MPNSERGGSSDRHEGRPTKPQEYDRIGFEKSWLERAAIVLMVTICLAVTYIAMLISERLVRRLRADGLRTSSAG